jgi:uncharacterized spore protein YtfJ
MVSEAVNGAPNVKHQEVEMGVHHFLESLGEKLRSSASVKTVYGDPIEAQGKTIIPVARVAYGLGGGYGKEKIRDQEGHAEERPAGESGGGGITVSPVGVFEVSQKQTSYVPLHSRKAALTGVFFAGIALGALLGGAKRIGV